MFIAKQLIRNVTTPFVMSRHIRHSSKKYNFIIWTRMSEAQTTASSYFCGSTMKANTEHINEIIIVETFTSILIAELNPRGKCLPVAISMNAMRRVYLPLLDFRKMISLSKWLFAMRLLASVAVCFPKKLGHTAKSSLFVCIIFFSQFIPIWMYEHDRHLNVLLPPDGIIFLLSCDHDTDDAEFNKRKLTKFYCEFQRTENGLPNNWPKVSISRMEWEWAVPNKLNIRHCIGIMHFHSVSHYNSPPQPPADNNIWLHYALPMSTVFTGPFQFHRSLVTAFVKIFSLEWTLATKLNSFKLCCCGPLKTRRASDSLIFVERRRHKTIFFSIRRKIHAEAEGITKKRPRNLIMCYLFIVDAAVTVTSEAAKGCFDISITTNLYSKDKRTTIDAIQGVHLHQVNACARSSSSTRNVTQRIRRRRKKQKIRTFMFS